LKTIKILKEIDLRAY